jgi:hypothetical protein
MDPRNPYAPPQATVADVNASGEPAPPLWNPGAATAWSLLLTPTFGALLHMKNWQVLGDPERAASAKRWAIGTAAFTLSVMGLVMIVPESSGIDLLIRACGLGVLLAWYYASGKAQVDLVKQRFGTTYPRRGWALPLVIGFGALVALLVTVFVIAFVATIAGGQF